MKKVLNFVKGKRDDKGPSKMNPQISVEITNPSGQKIPSDDEHIVGLQQGFGYSVDVSGKDKSMLKIHKASWFGNLEKLKLYAKKTDINTPDSQSRTCLHLAVAQGHTEVAWYLLNNNASITACDSDGLTPFLKAIECGQKDCTNLLIECGVDVSTADGDGNTGLHIASRSGFYNIASLLLKEGANLNVPNNSGNYPLHMATSCDHKDIVELLIKFGANVQVLDRERRTSLMLAARNGLSSIIKVLLENGALLETADSNGWTAEDYAQFGGHQDLMELLETKKKEVSFDQSDKLSVQSSDQSEHVAFEGGKTAVTGNGETTDSPRSCVMPPTLEPPRSWDLIQSGVMDQDGSLENRKSLLSLGNLKKGYETGSCELIVSPADNAPSSLSPSGDFPSDMRLSPEPLSLAPTPERRTRSPLERGHSFDMPSDNDSPLQGLSAEELNSICKPENTQLLNDNDNLEPNNVSKINNNMLNGKFDLEKQATIIINQGAFTEGSVNVYNEKNVSNGIDNPRPKSEELADRVVHNDCTYTMECSASYDDLDERSYCTDNQLTGVSSSLDNIDYDNGKSLSIEIIQSTGNLDDTLSITTTKNIFRECHSLELLEAEVGDSRSYKNSKRHHRNKSITLSGQPQLWKSAGTLPKTQSFDRGSIDAQLMCYDEALRQLAKVKKSTGAKDAQSNTSPVMDLKLMKSSKSLDHVEMKSVGSSPESYRGRSTEFRTPTDDELEYMDRDNNFPPPPIHFLQNEDNELCQLDCDDKSLQIDVLPMPISMLTPIKETQIECDSLSVAETFENEHSLSERSNVRSDGTPNHFNVEVIVNSKTPDASQSFDDAIVPEAPETSETTLQLIDDVFIEDPTLAEPYDRYFVDLKALEMVPSAVDFNKIVFPADSPSPKKGSKNYNNKPSSKFPSLHFVIGGICNVNSNKPVTELYKSDSESECFGKPLRKKRKLLLAMKVAGVGGSKDTDNDIDEDDIDDEDGESDEDDPPFWQNTEKGGFFVRQDTIVANDSESHFFTRPEIEAVPTTSFGKPAVRRSCGSPLQNSEAETASASDTPRLSPMGAKEPALSHLCEASLANGLLQEKAAALMGNTERLKYELEDARQAEAVRVDTISILQSQLSKLEAQYAEAQEEVCTLKQKADCAELELKHLRELCACLSRERNERPASSVKQLVDQATASTPTEDDYRQIHMQIMIKHLEDSKKLEEEKNHQLVRHLEEVLSTNQNMISEKEALIAQNIADVRKLQEDTLCWKDRYEELAAKLELLDKRLDPRLIEAQDTIATLKRTIAILQQEKSHLKRRWSYYPGPLPDSVASKGLSILGYDKDCIEDILRILKTAYGSPKNLNLYKFTVKETNSNSSKQSDSDDDVTRRPSQTDDEQSDEKGDVIKLYKSSYPSFESERIPTSSTELIEMSSGVAISSDETSTPAKANIKPDHQNGVREIGAQTANDTILTDKSNGKEHHPVCDDPNKTKLLDARRRSSLKRGSVCNSEKKRNISIKLDIDDSVCPKDIGVIHTIRMQSENSKSRDSSSESGPSLCIPLKTLCQSHSGDTENLIDSLPTMKELARDHSTIRIDIEDLNDEDRRSNPLSNQSGPSGASGGVSFTKSTSRRYSTPTDVSEDFSAGPKRLTTTSNSSGVAGVLKDYQCPSSQRSKSKSVIISSFRSVQSISANGSADGVGERSDDLPVGTNHLSAVTRQQDESENVGRRKSVEKNGKTESSTVVKEEQPVTEITRRSVRQGASKDEENIRSGRRRQSKNENDSLASKRSNSSKRETESTTSKAEVGSPVEQNSSAHKTSAGFKTGESSKFSSYDSTGASKSASRNEVLPVIASSDRDEQLQSSVEDSGIGEQVADEIRTRAVKTISKSTIKSEKSSKSAVSDEKRSATVKSLSKESIPKSIEGGLQQSIHEVFERNVEDVGTLKGIKEKSTTDYNNQPTVESSEEDGGVQKKKSDRVRGSSVDESSKTAVKGKHLKKGYISGSAYSKISANSAKETKRLSNEVVAQPHQQSSESVKNHGQAHRGTDGPAPTSNQESEILPYSKDESTGAGSSAVPLAEANSHIKGKLQHSKDGSANQKMTDKSSMSGISNKKSSPSEAALGPDTNIKDDKIEKLTESHSHVSGKNQPSKKDSSIHQQMSDKSREKPDKTSSKSTVSSKKVSPSHARLGSDGDINADKIKKLSESPSHVSGKKQPSEKDSGVQPTTDKSIEKPDETNSKSAIISKKPSPTHAGLGSNTDFSEDGIKKLTESASYISGKKQPSEDSAVQPTTDKSREKPDKTNSKSTVTSTNTQQTKLVERDAEVPSPPNQNINEPGLSLLEEDATMAQVSAKNHKSEENTSPLISIVDSRKSNFNGSEVSDRIISDIQNEPVPNSAEDHQPIESSEPLPISQQDQLLQGEPPASTLLEMEPFQSRSNASQINAGLEADHRREEMVSTVSAPVTDGSMTRFESNKESGLRNGVDVNPASQQVASSNETYTRTEISSQISKKSNINDQDVYNSGDQFAIKVDGEGGCNIESPVFEHTRGIDNAPEGSVKEEIKESMVEYEQTYTNVAHTAGVFKSDVRQDTIVTTSTVKSVSSNMDNQNAVSKYSELVDSESNETSRFPKTPADDSVLKLLGTIKSESLSKALVPKRSEMELQGMSNDGERPANTDEAGGSGGDVLKSKEDSGSTPGANADNAVQAPGKSAVNVTSVSSGIVVSAKEASLSVLQSNSEDAHASLPTSAVRNVSNALRSNVSGTSMAERAAAAREWFNASRGRNGSQSSKKQSSDSQRTIKNIEVTEGSTISDDNDHVGVKFSRKRQSYSYIATTSSIIQDKPTSITQGENAMQSKVIPSAASRSNSIVGESQPEGVKKERISLSVLPTIKEEVDEEHPLYVRQRETPAEFKKPKPPKQPSFASGRSSQSVVTDSEESISIDEDNEKKIASRDSDDTVFSRPAPKYRASDETCNCRSICSCCTCGKKKDPKAGLASKKGNTSTIPPPRQHHSHHPKENEGPFDYSTPPFPKDSLKVLTSPFFAHWAYYDVDQDHPVAKYMKRAEHTALDTECIVVKNYRLYGDECIPYINITARKKITTKLVCNYYKKRSLLSKKREALALREKDKGIDVSLTPGSSPPPGDIGIAKIESCHCKKKHTQKSGVTGDPWEGYVETEEEEFALPVELKGKEVENEQRTFQETQPKIGNAFCCDLGTDCTCADIPDVVRHKTPLLLPTSPCESCDCFIDELASETSAQSGHHRGSISTPISFEDSDSSKNLGIGEYFTTLQDLVIQLYGMLAKIKNVVEDTNSGSTPDKGGSGSTKSKKESTS